MKKYSDVVTDRYDHDHSFTNYAFSLDHSYAFYKIIEALQKNFFIENTNLLTNNPRILDLGCGAGFLCSWFAQYFNLPDNITGVDLSENRLSWAKNANPGIKYLCEDITKISFETETFDLITSFDTLMHLHHKEEILLMLKRVHSFLHPEGFFIWYEPYRRSHFYKNNNCDGCGFSAREMKEFAQASNFRIIKQVNLFKTVLGRHSLSLRKKIPPVFNSLIEKLYPGPPGNILFILQK